MSKKFKPKFSITPGIANSLMRIEAAKQCIKDLPIVPLMLEKLRETARLSSIHYSTQIEGNRLTKEQVQEVVVQHKNFAGRERDEQEVRGYYAALDFMEKHAVKGMAIAEKGVQILHALVMSGGRENVKPSTYRDGQNVIREGASGKIVYMPPEAKDVPELMQALVGWINRRSDLPCPIIAGIAHYQFATIHPYYDGNGRTARLLATLILHIGGYDLKGIYSLEEYYARNLSDYYEALTIGPSHNYYVGRAESDITKWVAYFCEGMANAVENIQKRVVKESKKESKEGGRDKIGQLGNSDQSALLKKLDVKQRKALEVFRKNEYVTSKQIEQFFGFKPRTARQLCKRWSDQGFIVVVDPSKKGRKYTLAPQFNSLLD
ncbi:Fic family protein [Candidatus Dependentiae bacterium]